MVYPRKNIEGLRFGRIVAVECVGSDKYSSPLWRCRCDCGGEVIAPTHNIIKKTRSCGCLRRETTGALSRTHGLSNKSAEYRCWKGMRRRCNNRNSTDWHLYGGRGIRVCERWNSFEAFLADMGVKPTPKHSIDRIDNNGNYEPGNCRWATPKEQRANQRSKSERFALGGLNARPMF